MTDADCHLKMRYELLKIRRNNFVRYWPFPIETMKNVTRYVLLKKGKVHTQCIDEIPDLSIYKRYEYQIRQVSEIEKEMYHIRKAKPYLFKDE